MAATVSKSRGPRLRTFLELVRFSHTIFALPFAIIAALMTSARPERISRRSRVASTSGSATTRRGFKANARAMPMRCRWPPENSCG